MKIPFSKMHGLGNDFMVLDNRKGDIDLSPMQIKQWSNRHWGVGFDQLLIVEKPKSKDAHFSYRIFNADGQEVEHCGNGARCFARYVHNQKLTDLKSIIVDTNKDQLVLNMDDNGYVTVKMGIPDFIAENIPLSLPQSDVYKLKLSNNEEIEFRACAISNPHAVIRVENTHQADVENIGSILESHEVFPNRVNVGFLEVIDRRNFNLRVYERGVGETQACGSGACAAAAVGIKAGWFKDKVTAHLLGGNLEITWAGEEQAIYMRGPAVEVFSGYINADPL